MTNAYMKLFGIEQKSKQDMELFRSQIRDEFQKKGIIEVRDMMGKYFEKIFDCLKDYQIVSYTHSFTFFRACTY